MRAKWKSVEGKRDREDEAGVDKRKRGEDDKREARLDILAILLPRTYGLRVIPSGTILFRGSRSEFELQSERPSPYAFYSSRPMHALEYASELGEGQNPMIRALRANRDIYVLDLDTLNYKRDYPAAELARMEEDPLDFDKVEDATEASIAAMSENFDGYDEFTDSFAYRWLSTDSNGDGTTETEMIDLLRERFPEIGGWVRNEVLFGVREMVIADPNAVDAIAVRIFTEEEDEEMYERGTGKLYNFEGEFDVTEQLSRLDAPSLVQKWYETADRLNEQFSSTDPVHKDTARHTIETAREDDASKVNPMAEIMFEDELASLMRRRKWTILDEQAADAIKWTD